MSTTQQDNPNNPNSPGPSKRKRPSQTSIASEPYIPDAEEIEELFHLLENEQPPKRPEHFKCPSPPPQPQPQPQPRPSKQNNAAMEKGLAFDSLSQSQKAAFHSIRSGKNTFVHGAAGTGKSHMIRFVRQTTPRVQVTASTGIAAALIGGKTIHSWSGIRVGITESDTLPDILKRCNRGAYKRNWLRTKLLIIDEFSMLSSDVLELLDKVGRSVRKSEAPFGGLQVVGVGDFMQLPPVRTPRDPPHTKQHCFKSPVFDQLFPANCGQRVELTQNFRQAGDTQWQQCLAKIRVGEVDAGVLEFLQTCVVPESFLDEMTPEQSSKHTVLYARNKNVDFENLRKLCMLEGEIVSCKHEFKPKPWLPKARCESLHSQMLSKCNCPDEFRFKVGARVMHTVNAGTLCNGSLGMVVGISERNNPVVDFESPEDPCKTVRYEVKKQTWTSDMVTGKKSSEAALVQYPLRLAFALTIHKSQGSTLSSGVLEMSGIFAPNMFFVAASRVRSAKKLKIINFVPDVIVTDQEALAMSRSISEESQRFQQPHQQLQAFACACK
jgi:ATP-dependent DNA helicase PIF1